jgi:hypothetical protein
MAHLAQAENDENEQITEEEDFVGGPGSGDVLISADNYIESCSTISN